MWPRIDRAAIRLKPRDADAGRMDEHDPRKTHETAVGAETEVGATSGRTHDQVLEQALGHERGVDLAARDGPPPPRRR